MAGLRKGLEGFFKSSKQQTGSKKDIARLHCQWQSPHGTRRLRNWGCPTRWQQLTMSTRRNEDAAHLEIMIMRSEVGRLSSQLNMSKRSLHRPSPELRVNHQQSAPLQPRAGLPLLAINRRKQQPSTLSKPSAQSPPHPTH